MVFRFTYQEIKIFYRTLEDIWNYRAQLPQAVKNNIVPT